MNLSTKLYRAYTMAEALAAVKRDLGPEAVILQTRTLMRRRFLGLGKTNIVEVTATSSPQDEGVATPIAATPRPRPKVEAKAARTPRAVAAVETKPDAVPTAEDFDQTRRLARMLLERHESSAADDEPAPVLVDAVVGDDPPPIPVAPAPPAPKIRSKPPAGAKPPTNDGAPKRFILRPEVEPDRATETPVSSPELASMQSELGAIREMIGQVLVKQSQNGSEPTPAMPPALFDVHLRLIEQEVDEQTATDIVEHIRRTMGKAALENPDTVRAAALRELEALIPVADLPVPEASPDGRPLVIALVGPTGVGKTTTLAKLAALLKVRESRRVGLITSDTYRIAAVDQLRTYANIIGLPLEVVLTPDEMRGAVQTLSDRDVILIDTAGRGQKDVRRIEELRGFIDAASPHEVHLVLSSTAGAKVLEHEAEAFGAVGVDKVLLSKLDEAVSFGPLVEVMRRIGKPASFVTTGQEVPEHIEPADARRLAERLLGEVVPA